jgi:hypothetical protein
MTSENLPDEPIQKKSTKEAEKEEVKSLWDSIGFHKPVAGFWNNLLYQIGVLILPALIAIQLLKVLYPYPESRGYRDAFTGIFVLIFTVFDLGTSATISRFIADENIKNPARMVKYIQYFIWYQAITGLIQLTVISFWALNFAINTELAYGIWIMLVCVTKQYPGFPGAFKGVLSALQMYDKANMINFIQNQGIQVVTEIVFVLLGKAYGRANPEVGEILGIAIGATFGLYLDDVLAAFIAAFYLSKALQPYGITFKDLFVPSFGWDIIKECTIFGVKLGLPGLLFASTKLLSLALCLKYIPQYTTYAALAALAGQLVAMVDRLVYQDFTAIFTEAYQNNKKKLCQYYFAHTVRFFVLNSGFAVVIMLIFNSMFEQLFLGVGLEYYLLTIPFIIPCLFVRLVNPYKKFTGTLLVAAHRPNQLMVINLIFESLKLLAWVLTVEVFHVYDLGIMGLVYVLVLTEFPVEILHMMCLLFYVNKKVFKLKLITYQTIVVPAAACGILFGVFELFKILFLNSMWTSPLLGDNAFWFTLVFAVILMVLLVLGFYFPLTMLLGGWDDNSIRDLRAAVKMCGPSRLIVVPMTKLLFKAMPHSKLHNRFKFPEAEAVQEIEELIAIRDANRENILEKIDI